MTEITATAQSALSALSTSMAVTANNVANADTDGYRSQQASLGTGTDGQGVRISTIADENMPLPGTQPSSSSGSDVDLVRQSVAMITVPRAFEANVAVLRAADDMTGTVLDMRV